MGWLVSLCWCHVVQLTSGSDGKQRENRRKKVGQKETHEERGGKAGSHMSLAGVCYWCNSDDQVSPLACWGLDFKTMQLPLGSMGKGQNLWSGMKQRPESSSPCSRNSPSEFRSPSPKSLSKEGWWADYSIISLFCSPIRANFQHSNFTPLSLSPILPLFTMSTQSLSYISRALLCRLTQLLSFIFANNHM